VILSEDVLDTTAVVCILFGLKCIKCHWHMQGFHFVPLCAKQVKVPFKLLEVCTKAVCTLNALSVALQGNTLLLLSDLTGHGGSQGG